MSTLKFWDRAAKGIYDEYVLGKSAPKQIKDFILEEDRRINLLLEDYVKKGKKVVFVEIGSGTGRYLRFFGKKIFTDKDFSRNLKYIIGVDFSEVMIRTSIENLVRSRKIGERLSVSLADELVRILKIPRKRVVEQLSRRIMLVNGDVTAKPLVRVEGSDVVTGVMFGTLGNIAAGKRDIALRNISAISTSEEVFITVFDRHKMQTGWRIYRDLSMAGFSLLRPLVTHNSEFTTPKGFYSQWFRKKDFNSLLENSFDGNKIRIFSYRHGLFARIKVKKRISVGALAVYLGCQKCGEVLSRVPLPSVTPVKCNSCGSSYEVREHFGFRYPVMMEKKR